jgi:hypothetical protein
MRATRSATRSPFDVRLPRPGYASVLATLALFLAVGGPAFAGAKVLLTGNDIADGSLTSQDVRNGSLQPADFSARGLALLRGSQGARGVDGPQGERGPAGPAGAPGERAAAGPAGAPAALPSSAASGPDVVGYTDYTPLVAVDVPSAGSWVVVGRFHVTNTGVSDDYLNCVYDAGGVQSGVAGAQVSAGDTAAANPVNVVSFDSPGTVSLRCGGSGVTSFDITGISVTAIRLA